MSTTKESVSPRRKRSLFKGFLAGAIGGLVGSGYGALAEYQPAITSKLGASFGLTLCGITHASALPMMGLTETPENQPAREHASELVTHAIYGVTTELVRRVARRII